MATRPDDDWFRSAGWTEFNHLWARDYYDDTVKYMKKSRLLHSSFCGDLGWAADAINDNDPVALHNAWLQEEKRRNTPLDPDGWTHLKNVGEHTSGYHHIRQSVSNDWFNVFGPDGNFFVSRSPLEDVIDACNDHAKKNGVKSC